MTIRERIQEAWDDPDNVGPVLGTGLRVLEGGFRAAVRLRSFLFERGVLPVEEAAIPVVSVGNLRVGGTGKTPIVRWIVDVLAEAGERPGVVLRGYGGDETLLHRRWYPDVPVIEDADRVRGVSKAARAGATVAVCDDAFQHRRLARDLDVVLLSADGSSNRRLMPAGPYRESFHALGRADFICITQKGPPDEQADRLMSDVRGAGCTAPVCVVPLEPSGWTRLNGSPGQAPEGPILIVTGVGSPATVDATVRTALTPTAKRNADGPEIETMAFPDHHTFSADDVHRCLTAARGRAIVVTEKDAVKLEQFAELADCTWVIGLEVGTGQNLEELQTRVLAAAKRQAGES